jgi:hypothetical protein
MKDGLLCSTFKSFFSEYKTKQIADVENDGSHELAMKQARGLGYKVGKRFKLFLFHEKVVSSLQAVDRTHAAALKL